MLNGSEGPNNESCADLQISKHVDSPRLAELLSQATAAEALLRKEDFICSKQVQSFSGHAKAVFDLCQNHVPINSQVNTKQQDDKKKFKCTLI